MNLEINTENEVLRRYNAQRLKKISKSEIDCHYGNMTS